MTKEGVDYEQRAKQRLRRAYADAWVAKAQTIIERLERGEKAPPVGMVPVLVAADQVLGKLRKPPWENHECLCDGKPGCGCLCHKAEGKVDV